VGRRTVVPWEGLGSSDAQWKIVLQVTIAEKRGAVVPAPISYDGRPSVASTRVRIVCLCLDSNDLKGIGYFDKIG
jgi:hypothetical protein